MRAHLRHHGAERAQYFRQILRPDDNERDDPDDEKLTPTDVEHVRTSAAAERRPGETRRASAAQPTF